MKPALSEPMQFVLCEMATGRPLYSDPDNGLYHRLYPKPMYLGDLTPIHIHTVSALCQRRLLVSVKSPKLHFKLTQLGREAARKLSGGARHVIS